MGDPHQMIISDMCKMISRKTVSFNEYDIDVIIHRLDLAFDNIRIHYPFLGISW